jgi:hypothetical protein
MNIQPGDFCCIPINGNVGTLISIGEWLNGDGFGHYDHSEIFIGEPDIYGPYGYTIGAYPGGATRNALSVKPEDLTDTIWSSSCIQLSSQERLAIVANAKKSIGIPYSSLDYFALIAHRLRIPIPGLQAYISSSGHMICSQLVDYVYMKSGVQLFDDNRWCGYVTPADLANLIKDD